MSNVGVKPKDLVPDNDAFVNQVEPRTIDEEIGV